MQAQRPEGFDLIRLSGVEAGAGRQAGRRPLLLSRGLYRQKTFDLSRLRAADRMQSLRLQVLAWAPFDGAAYLVGLDGPSALVFAWDARALKALLESAQADTARAVVPEGLHRATLQEGIRLHACLDGYEAQAWRAGRLMDSRWWPQVPEAASWATFTRAQGLAAPGTVAPDLLATPWTRRPWTTTVSLERLGQMGPRWEYWLGLGALCTLAAWGGHEGHRWYAAQQLLQQARAQAGELAERAAPQMKARDEALVLADRANRLAQALTAPAPLEVLEQLALGLPARGVTLQELVLEGRNLRISLLLGPEVQRAAVVQQLRASGYFAEVVEARDQAAGGAVTFELKLGDSAAALKPNAAASSPVPAPPMSGSAAK